MKEIVVPAEYKIIKRRVVDTTASTKQLLHNTKPKEETNTLNSLTLQYKL